MNEIDVYCAFNAIYCGCLTKLTNVALETGLFYY